MTIAAINATIEIFLMLNPFSFQTAKVDIKIRIGVSKIPLELFAEMDKSKVPKLPIIVIVMLNFFDSFNSLLFQRKIDKLMVIREVNDLEIGFRNDEPSIK